MHRLGYTLSFLLLILTAPAWAESWPVRDMAVLADPSGSRTIDDISDAEAAADFEPLAASGFSGGYTRQVHWLRFRLDAPADGRLLLEVMPPYLDDLKLFVPDGGGGFDMRQGGDLHPFSSREIPGRNFLFLIDLDQEQSQTFYLRVSTTSTSLVILRAWHPAAYANTMATEYLLLGLYYGLLLAMILFNLWHGHWRHDAEHRSFLAYLLTVFLFMLAVNGLVAQYLAPEHPAVSQHWLSGIVLITVGMAADFYRRTLAIDRQTPLLNAYFRGMIALSALCFFAYLAGYFTEAARILTMAALLFPVLGIARTVTLWRQGRAGSAFLIIGFGTSLISYLITALSVQGILPGEELQLYSFQAGALLALLAFNFSLFERLRHIQRQRDMALEEASQARSERDAENLARQRQGALIDMLTHELKTPLSVIRLRLDEEQPSQRIQSHAKRAAAAIQDIIQRCDFASHLDDNAIPVQPATCRLDVIVNNCLEQRQPHSRIQLLVPTGLDTTLVTDPGLLSVLIDNLVDNACKYSPPDAPIRIEMAMRHEDTHPGLVFSISNPVGSAGRPDSSQLFDKYYRSPGARGLSGSGLGLAISRNLARLLCARLRYLPDREDIVFELWLPRSAS